MFFYSPSYFLYLIPAMLLVMYAQFKVKAAFAKYSKVGTRSGLSGAQVARDILDRAGLTEVPVEVSQGWLSDHYDPVKKALRLSPDVYNGHSVASVGVAAHEAGHALQHKTGYLPLNLRTGFYPVAGIGDKLGPILVILSLFIPAFRGLFGVGILLFSAAVLFYVITLPVEFNASRRAMLQLVEGGYVTREEEYGARKVLNAAALTYVAAAAQAVMTLLYYVSLRDRDD